MGCHTYCYVHIPESEEAWENEYIDDVRDGSLANIKYIEKMTDAQIVKLIKQEVNDNLSYISSIDKARETDTLHKFLVYFDNDENKLNEYIKSLIVSIDECAPESYRNEMIRYEQNIIDIIDNHTGSKLELVKKLKFEQFAGSISFGTFKIKDNKIYRNTCANKDDKPVFEYQFHDMFRINDFNAKPCYSLEETLERCKEYNIDWNEKFENGELKNDLFIVNAFWDTYPDGIIEFG